MRALVSFFVHRHLLTNIIFFGTLLIAIFAWDNLNKEEMPEFAMDWLRVSVVYSGAPAEDVELFITKPIEEELKGISGIYEITSTSSLGSSSFSISLEPSYPDKDQTIQDIKDAVLRVNLPAEVRDNPRFRQFKSTEKAIIDIAMIHKKSNYLDADARRELQKYALSFENQLASLPEISTVDKSGYLAPELQVLVDPVKLKNMEISLSDINSQIKKNHVRYPVGSLNDRGESKVTALNELDTVDSLQELILRSSYTGPAVKLGDIATIRDSFEKSNTVTKVQGREAVIFNVKKSTSYDILAAKEALMKFVDMFNKTNADSPVEIVLMDDESFDVTNRLSIIYSNGLLGFMLILVVLFLFLNFKTGFWVAMGIPFSLAFTIILTLIAGYTLNNITLAGIILVMGIVVDDAIIIAENIVRRYNNGEPLEEAAVQGTLEVIAPVLASIITTCVAFVPLFYFEGHFGKFVSYIPLMVILMLAGSFLESLIILPSHLVIEAGPLKTAPPRKKDWFTSFEDFYEKLLNYALHYRWLIIVLFVGVLMTSGYIFKEKMKFSMFPREETQEIFVNAAGAEDLTRMETAKLIEPLERIFLEDEHKVVVAVRSRVGQSRRGGEVKENEAWVRVELLPADQRKVPLSKLMNEWEEKAKKIDGFVELKFLKSHFGRGSGSAIELLVQENNDSSRKNITEKLKTFMATIDGLDNVEIERPLIKTEYIFKINQEKMVRFDIDPANVTSALRSFVEGSILYTINKGDEEVDVRVTVPEESKVDLKELLNLKVQNKSGQLVYLNKFVSIKEEKRPSNISRTNYKRTTSVYGDLASEAKITPLEVAEKMESDIFPEIYKEYPGVILRFIGEIEDSRSSESNFQNSLLLVVILIYFILVIMFNSVVTPFIIIAIVPFSLASAAMALLFHGMSVYGFFAIVGALGMIGVVINDSIVMIDRYEKNRKNGVTYDFVAAISKTRLRPVLLTTITTVVALFPTAYGVMGYDSMLAEMMLTMGWGLLFSTVITLVLVPCLYSFFIKKEESSHAS